MKAYYDEELDDYVIDAGGIPYSVTRVEPCSNYSLIVDFADGSRRLFDCKSLLQKPMYKQLNQTALFMRAKVAHGTVDWGDDIDIAPETLYEYGVMVDTTQHEPNPADKEHES